MAEMRYLLHRLLAVAVAAVRRQLAMPQHQQLAVMVAREQPHLFLARL
jgi:hypothetical protein